MILFCFANLDTDLLSRYKPSKMGLELWKSKTETKGQSDEIVNKIEKIKHRRASVGVQPCVNIFMMEVEVCAECCSSCSLCITAAAGEQSFIGDLSQGIPPPPSRYPEPAPLHTGVLCNVFINITSFLSLLLPPSTRHGSGRGPGTPHPLQLHHNRAEMP